MIIEDVSATISKWSDVINESTITVLKCNGICYVNGFVSVRVISSGMGLFGNLPTARNNVYATCGSVISDTPLCGSVVMTENTNTLNFNLMDGSENQNYAFNFSYAYI